MTEASFVDRRTDEQRKNRLATQVLFWYDEDFSEIDGQPRRRVNAIAIDTDGTLIVARATCSPVDQFVKAHGRMVAEKRLLGRAQKSCWLLAPAGDGPEGYAAAYAGFFPGDEIGEKRAYNVGKIYASWVSNNLTS